MEILAPYSQYIGVLYSCARRRSFCRSHGIRNGFSELRCLWGICVPYALHAVPYFCKLWPNTISYPPEGIRAKVYIERNASLTFTKNLSRCIVLTRTPSLQQKHYLTFSCQSRNTRCFLLLSGQSHSSFSSYLTSRERMFSYLDCK